MGIHIDDLRDDLDDDQRGQVSFRLPRSMVTVFRAVREGYSVKAFSTSVLQRYEEVKSRGHGIFFQYDLEKGQEGDFNDRNTDDAAFVIYAFDRDDPYTCLVGGGMNDDFPLDKWNKFLREFKKLTDPYMKNCTLDDILGKTIRYNREIYSGNLMLGILSGSIPEVNLDSQAP